MDQNKKNIDQYDALKTERLKAMMEGFGSIYIEIMPDLELMKTICSSVDNFKRIRSEPIGGQTFFVATFSTEKGGETDVAFRELKRKDVLIGALKGVVSVYTDGMTSELEIRILLERLHLRLYPIREITRVADRLSKISLKG